VPSNEQFVANNKQWMTTTSKIRVESKFLKTDMANHTNFSVYINLKMKTKQI
jgi:hypothetical protein